MTNITTNMTTQPNMEYGCKITQSVTSKKDVEQTQLVKMNIILRVDTLK